MKCRKYLFVLLVCAVWLPLFGQSRLEIGPYGGLNYPALDFKNLSENGYGLGLNTDFYFAKKWGIGLDVNHQSADFSAPIDLNLIPEPQMGEYAVNTSILSKWRSTTFALGPTFRIGTGRLNFDIYSKAGVSFINKPLVASTFTFSGLEKELLSFSSPGDEMAVGIISGVRLNASLGNRIGIFVNPHFVYAAKTIDYQYVDINEAFITDPNGVEVFDPGLLVEQPAIESGFQVAFINISAGIKFRFGGNKPSKEVEEPPQLSQEPSVICSPAKLLAPLNKESFSASAGIFPEFEWSKRGDGEVKSYTLELYDPDRNLVYEQSTPNTSLQVDGKFENLLKKSDGGDYFWRVVTDYQNCAAVASGFRSFTVSADPNRGGCDYVFTNNFHLECDEPAYDADGNLRYKGYITVANRSSTDGFLSNHPNGVLGQHIDIDIPGASLNLVNCASLGYTIPPAAVLPAGYSPGQVVTYCFELTVPFGTTTVNFLSQIITKRGAKDQGVCDASKTLELPPCICDICEDWGIQMANAGISKLSGNYPPDGGSVFNMGVDVVIPGSAPIKEVIAEVVSVQHEISDPQCHSCTKDHTRMGLFMDQGNFVVSNQPWDNTRKAYLSDPLSAGGDSHGNEIRWKAQDVTTGIDFSASQRFMSRIALPQLSTLECCHSKFTVCVRYTFFDINCKTCEEIVCHEYDTNDPGGNGTGLGSGVGNQQSGNGLNNNR